jgi:glutamine cyclotransferase
MSIVLLLLWLSVSVSAIGLAAKQDFRVLKSFEHDASSFVQGLILHTDGFMYESGGLYHKSNLRKVDPASGRVIQSTKLPAKYFAEGITIVGNLLYMLTWRESVMLIFDLPTMSLVDTKSFRSHSGQGWGLTFDGQHLIASDGSDVLTTFELPVVDGKGRDGSWGRGMLAGVGVTALKKVTHVSVTRDGKPIKLVNELEYVDGYIYANIWYMDEIIKIDPSTGVVIDTIDMHALWPKGDRNKGADCLNGIAYNSSDDTFVLTGKLWPKYYKVKFRNELMPAATSGGHKHRAGAELM